MADRNGVNYAKEIAKPSEQAEPGSRNAPVRVLLDYTLGSVAVAGDVISLGKIPKGARVIRCSNVGGGTSPSYSVAPMQKMTDEAVVTFTVGTTPAADVYAFVEYVLN
jgi:hypothetical protein